MTHIRDLFKCGQGTYIKDLQNEDKRISAFIDVSFIEHCSHVYDSFNTNRDVVLQKDFVIHICVYIYICVYVYLCTYVCQYECGAAKGARHTYFCYIYIYVCIYIYICKYMKIYMYVYIHI